MPGLIRLQSLMELRDVLFNAMTDGVLISDRHSVIVDCNTVFHQRLGYAKEELIGISIKTLDTPAYAALVPQRVAMIERQGEATFETEHRRKDGSVMSVEINARFCHIGEEIFFFGIVRDITERKRLELAYREGMEIYQAAINTPAMGFWVVDPADGRFLEVNDAYVRLSGFSRAELLKMGITDVEAAEDPAEVARHIGLVLSNGHDRFCSRHRRKDGSSWPVEVVVTHTHAQGGRFMVFIEDITDRKRTEDQLFATLNNTPNVAIQWFDRRGRVTYWNAASEILFGWSSEEALGKTLDQLLYGPKEAAAFLEMLDQIDRSGRPCGPFETAFTARNGDTGWLLSTTFSIPMIDGDTGFVCMDVDITERKHFEEQLRLYANIFEHSGEAILVADADNRIVAVNPAFTYLTGYTLDEVKGKNPRFLASKRTPKEIYEAMWAALRERDFWQGELWDRHKDGHLYPKWIAISVIRDGNGAVAHYIANFTDITERKESEERIMRLAHFDPLTGLFNRFSLQERLEQSLLNSARNGSQLVLMFIDMDRFKVINDTVGHHIGDELLIEVGRRLHDCVRDSDIVARLGGDEFIVVLTGLNSALSAGAKVADKIVESLSRPFLIKEHELHSSPSIGISIFPNDGGTADELMKTADTAMYHAKELGRNNYQFFTEAMNQATNDRLRFENDLRKALGTRQFELYYQPQIEALSGGVIGVEALIRWRHPVHGFVAPTKFIPVAEEIGLIKELGAWVLEEGLRAFAEWRDMGFESLRIAVNFSACQLQDADIVADVERLLAKFRLPRGSLELEITESVAMANPEQAICVLSGLRDLGVALAIDDFGTGYSSLAYLKRLPIQTLKLDRAFVRDIETDANDAAISSATLALAHNMGLKVVAEGVETEGQRAFLLDHRCDVFQGFLFSKPLSRTQIEDYLAARRKGS